jgi:hypothetical protein
LFKADGKIDDGDAGPFGLEGDTKILLASSQVDFASGDGALGQLFF